MEKEYGEKSDYAYNLIKEKIFSWEYGPGQRLNVSKMSKEMELSAIPLREALSRLQSSKLVVLIPNKGYQVTDILDEISMKKMSEFRLMLESESIKTIIRSNKLECLSNLEKINEKIRQIQINNYKDILEFNNLDYMFHSVLIKNSENKYLIESFESLFCHLHIARFYYRRGSVDRNETIIEHEKIIKSIQMRDLEYGLEFIKDHILGASSRLLEKDLNKHFKYKTINVRGVVIMEKYGHFIDGQWIEAGEIIPVTNKYTGDTYGEIYEADESIVNRAVQNAYESFEKNELSAEERFAILNKAVSLIDERKLELAELLIYEAGKTRKDAVTEIERGISTLRASAEEAKRITGQGVALPNSADKGKLAFTVRVPVGVIVAITPFNFPFNLTVHKIGPALAAGNAVVLKPAEMTPLIACKLVEIFKEAGLPDGLFNLVNGRGTQTGEYLLKNDLVDMYTFTGSPKVGQLIKSKTGIRKVALELGNNSPNIVHKDVDDLKRAAELCVSRGFSNAGQACISVQRIYVHEEVYDQFLKYATEFTKSLVLCSEDNPDGDVGPVISEREAVRIESWIEEAVQQGAKIIVGGQRKRSQFEPTILADVSQSMKVVCEEIFGPVITIQKYQDIDDVLHKANDSTMGLQVGIFTSNIQIVMKSIKKLKFGGVIINNVSTYREDVMPYGGVKNSGIGKEGPKYAILEMTEEKLIVLDA